MALGSQDCIPPTVTRTWHILVLYSTGNALGCGWVGGGGANVRACGGGGGGGGLWTAVMPIIPLCVYPPHSATGP